jgi:MFS family permease
MENTSSEKPKQEKRESLLLNLAINIVIPVIILTRFSGEDRLGATNGLLIALAFPVAYAIYDFARRRKFSFMSAIGFVGILVTVGIGLLELDPQWIAVKEAGVPLIIGVAIIGSQWTRYPLIRTFFGQILDNERIDEALSENGTTRAYNKRLTIATYLVGAAFFLSATLNYILARVIVVSPAGTPAFNEEFGRMTALSFLVIAVPTLVMVFIAIWYLVAGLIKLTGLDPRELMRQR